MAARSLVCEVGVEEKARLKHDLQCVWIEGVGTVIEAADRGIRGGMAALGIRKDEGKI